MSLYVLLAFALLVSVLIGGLLGRLWQQREARDVQEKWRERERLLDRRNATASRHEVLRRRSRPRGLSPMDRRRAGIPGRRERSGRA